MFTHLADSPRRQLAAIALLAALCYFPFVNKALHLDGDMLVHTARQYLVDPVDPPLGEYGRYMSFHDHTKMPESSVFYRTGHPPFLAMLLAPVVALAGQATWPLHAVLFAFYLMSVFALWHLLGLFFDKGYRFWGTLLWTVSPCLLLNSHNIMWDTPIAGLTLLSFALFLSALRSESGRLILLSGIVAGIGAVTKVSILPLFILFPLYLLITRRFRFLLLWLLPAVIPPLLWVLHNIIVYNRIHYLSVGWYSFDPGNIRYRLERIVSYSGGALMLPVFWVWLMVARRNWKGLSLSLLPACAWGVLLHVKLDESLWYAAACALFAAAGLWLLWRTFFFFRDARTFGGRIHEAWLVSAFCVLYFMVLNIMPSSSMRYILPIVPFGLLVVGAEVRRLSSLQRRRFLPVAVAAGGLFSLALATGDYLVCEADRRLPEALLDKGYETSNTWYYGRLSYDWYLHEAGFRHLRGDPDRPLAGAYLINRLVPRDYPAEKLLSHRLRFVVKDTIAFFEWPLHTMGYRGGFYGGDRLPYSLRFGVPTASYRVTLMKEKNVEW